MEHIFETVHLRVRKFEPEDAQCLYENHLEEEVKKWIPNESYADMDETRGAINFYMDCVNNKHLQKAQWAWLCYGTCKSND